MVCLLFALACAQRLGSLSAHKTSGSFLRWASCDFVSKTECVKVLVFEQTWLSPFAGSSHSSLTASGPACKAS
jgi:hypothetical protein